MAGDEWAPIEPSRPEPPADADGSPSWWQGSTHVDGRMLSERRAHAPRSGPGSPRSHGVDAGAGPGPRHMATSERAMAPDASAPHVAAWVGHGAVPPRQHAATTRRVGVRPGRLVRLTGPMLALAALGALVGLATAAATGGVSLAARADTPPSLTGPSGGAAGDHDGARGEPAAGERTPQQGVARAAHLLDEAGTFAYRGTVDMGGPSLARPGFPQDGLMAVEGEVELPARTHEIATTMHGLVRETAVRNITVWGRTAADEDDLGAQPFEIIGELRGGVAVPSGAALLPEWLMATTDRQAEAPDAQGRERFRADLPGWTGAGVDGGPGPDAEVVLTVDHDGEPARVEVTAVADGRSLRLDLEISRLGEPVGEWPPGGRPTSATGEVAPGDVVDAGIPYPLELGDVPEGWILYDIGLRSDSPSPGCSTLTLEYQHADEVATGWRRYLTLDVTSADCSFGPEWGDPLVLGAFTGTGTTSDGVVGYVSDGRTRIEVWTDLPVEEVEALFATLEPFDPTTRPEH